MYIYIIYNYRTAVVVCCLFSSICFISCILIAHILVRALCWVHWLQYDTCLVCLLLLFADPKEETFPISSPSIQLACDNGLKVNNIDVVIRQSSTTCLPIIPECTLPTEAIATIKEKCNKQVSCDVDIRHITNNQSCLQEYGYFNVWYTCKCKCFLKISKRILIFVKYISI